MTISLKNRFAETANTISDIVPAVPDRDGPINLKWASGAGGFARAYESFRKYRFVYELLAYNNIGEAVTTDHGGRCFVSLGRGKNVIFTRPIQKRASDFLLVLSP